MVLGGTTVLGAYLMSSFFWTHVSFIDEGISGISLVLAAPKRIPKSSSLTVVNGKHLLATFVLWLFQVFLLRSRYITDYHSILVYSWILPSSVVELSIDPRSVLISVQWFSNGRSTHGDWIYFMRLFHWVFTLPPIKTNMASCWKITLFCSRRYIFKGSILSSVMWVSGVGRFKTHHVDSTWFNRFLRYVGYILNIGFRFSFKVSSNKSGQIIISDLTFSLTLRGS